MNDLRQDTFLITELQDANLNMVSSDKSLNLSCSHEGKVSIIALLKCTLKIHQFQLLMQFET